MEAIYFLVKVKQDQTMSNETRSQWEAVYFYKILGKFTNLLHYTNTFWEGNFDQRTANRSYQSSFLKAFSYFALNGKAGSEKQTFLQFLKNSIEYIYVEEIPLVLTQNTFEDVFIRTLSPMLAQLSSLEKQESPDQIEYVLRYFIDSYWEPLIKAFKTIQLFKGDPTGKRVQIVDDYLVKAFKEEALTRVERVNPIFSDDEVQL